jgi:hypothetical protein
MHVTNYTPTYTSCISEEESSKKPNPSKQQKHREEKAQPHPPAYARPLGHAQHAVHRAAETQARGVEGVVH